MNARGNAGQNARLIKGKLVEQIARRSQPKRDVDAPF